MTTMIGPRPAGSDSMGSTASQHGIWAFHDNQPGTAYRVTRGQTLAPIYTVKGRSRSSPFLCVTAPPDVTLQGAPFLFFLTMTEANAFGANDKPS